MTIGFNLICGILCSLILASQCVSEKNWDLLYYLKTDRNIHMTDEVTLKLTSLTNFSKLFLSPKQFFPDNNLPDNFVIFAKLKIKKKIKQPITLITISDPDYKSRLKVSFKASPGFVDKIEMTVIYNPVSFLGEETKKDLLLPFSTNGIWTVALLFTTDKIILYTSCWDKKQPVEYQSVKIPINSGRILFKDGAILQLFSDVYHGQKLKGEIFELSFANYPTKINDLCHDIEGSGNKRIQIYHGMVGNLLLKTVKMDEDDTTTAATKKPDLKWITSTPQITEITTPEPTFNFESHLEKDFYTTAFYEKEVKLEKNQDISSPATPNLKNSYKIITKHPGISSVESTKSLIYGSKYTSRSSKLSSNKNMKPDVTTPAEYESDDYDFMNVLTTRTPVAKDISSLSKTKLSKHSTTIATPSMDLYKKDTSTVGAESRATDEEKQIKKDSTPYVEASGSRKISSSTNVDKGTTTDETRTTKISYSKSLNFAEDSKSNLMAKSSDSSIEESLENFNDTDSLSTDSTVIKSKIKIDDVMRIINKTERFIKDNTTVKSLTGYQMSSSVKPIESTSKNIIKSHELIDGSAKPEQVMSYSTQSSAESETFTRDSDKKKEIMEEDTPRSKSVSNEKSSTSSVSQNVTEFGSKNSQQVKVSDKRHGGCQSKGMDECRKWAGRNITTSSQIDEEGKRDCMVLSKLRLAIPQKGAQGETGLKGDQGEKGNQGHSGLDGVCNAKACGISDVIKGPKGDPGICKASECVSVKGDKGLNGQKGDSGKKGSKGDSSSMDGEMIRSIVSSVVKAEVEYLGVKGEKGNEGNCKCNQKLSKVQTSSNRYDETYNVGFGSLVFENKETLEQVSSKLPPGSMVYILKSDIFIVKIDELNNIWRVISLDSKSKDWILPHPIRTKPVENTRVPYTNGIAKKLHLIALSLPTMGDLKQMIRQPGGYSGAIFQCQQAGDVYGFGRSLYPLLNTEAFSIKYSIKETYRNIPILNTRGEILANDFVALLSENESLQNDILDFKKNPISTNIISPCVWIGKEQGIYDNEYDKNSESKCLNWMTRDPLAKGLVYLINPQKALFDESNKQLRSCSQQCYILCIQTEPHE